MSVQRPRDVWRCANSPVRDAAGHQDRRHRKFISNGWRMRSERPCSRGTGAARESWGKLEKAFNGNEKVQGVSSIKSRAASPSI
jgi:hypothetical protein